MGYIDNNGNYYEGDRQGIDLEVPQRPTPYHDWAGSWIENVPRAKASQLNTLQRQRLEALEFAANPLGTSPALLESYRMDYAAANLILQGNGALSVYDSVPANDYLQNRATTAGVTIEQYSVGVKYNYETAGAKARPINDKWATLATQVNAATTGNDVLAIVW